MSKFITSIDLGTTSQRVVIYDTNLKHVASHQLEYKQISLHPGWTEQDPMEVYKITLECIEKSISHAKNLHEDLKISTIGITNQRETTIVWDSETGLPLHNAIVWHDTRTKQIVDKLIKEKGQDCLRDLCGLPISTYFSSVKLKWLLENVKEVQEAVKQKKCMFGTFDTWLIWRLTGGVNGGIYATDVTNASRTMLMNLNTLQWDSELLKFFEIPDGVLFPKIKASSDDFGICKDGPLKGVPINGCIGDQQAAGLGHGCFEKGDLKNTYGTGCFLLMNTGEKPVISKSGLITTVGYQNNNQKPFYCLEGSVAVCGSGLNWLVNNLKLIHNPKELDEYCKRVENTGGVYFVPSFTGLFAPYWDMNAKGTLIGMTFFTTGSHIARALVEGICYQNTEVIQAMEIDSGIKVNHIHVDGGVSKSDVLIQTQSNFLQIPIARSNNSELTSKGAAIAAGIGNGIWKDFKEVGFGKEIHVKFEPKMKQEEVEELLKKWKKAVQATKLFD